MVVQDIGTINSMKRWDEQLEIDMKLWNLLVVGFKDVLNSYVLRIKISADSCLKALGERLDQVD